MDIDAFILVGGRSRRFGSDKANIVLDGRLLLEKTIQTIRSAIDPNRILLVAANDAQFFASPATMLSLPFIFDIYESRGPLGAIHTALAHAQSEWAYITACDYPFVCPEVIVRLAANMTDDVDAVAAIQPDGRVQPLLAFYRVRAVLKVIEEQLIEDRSTTAAKTVFDNVPSSLLPFEKLNDLPNASEVFFNVNTPANLQRAMKIK